MSLDESVSLALLVTLEQLTPPERVSLIMHDVFGMPFTEIAEIVGRTPDACRQLASTARRHIRSQPRFEVASPERDRVVQAFARACLDGDLVRLAAVLDADVVARADGGGHISAARRSVVGADEVARYLLGVTEKQRGQTTSLNASIEEVNGRSGIVLRDGERIIAIVDLGIVGDRVQQISLVVNPEKFTALSWP